MLVGLLAGFIVVYLAGPSSVPPRYDQTLPDVPDAVDQFLAGREAKHRLKPDNHARIIWRDSAHRKTEYAVIYLHGFSASQKEGDPVHRRFAETFGCNLLLTRIADHGVDTTDALFYFTADRAWESAKLALRIGEKIGDKIILMGTSTGSTLALMLAATYPDKVHALINMSPNIEINDPAAFLLNNPWGLHIARWVLGGKCRDTGASPEHARYWNKQYRVESLVQLQELLETTMHEETFKRVRQPSLTLYYYKNEEEQDPQVRVSAMLEMHELLATPPGQKVALAIPSAGAHVLGCALTSNDVDGVYAAMERFATERLGMTPYDPAMVSIGPSR